MKNQRMRKLRAGSSKWRMWLIPEIALVALAVTGCAPPAENESEPVPPTASVAETSVEAAEVREAQNANFRVYLQRLGESSLSDNCTEEITSYRLFKLEFGSVAAVRIYRDAESAGYRSATSLSLDTAISSDGYVGERMWDRIEAELGYSDFWNLESKRYDTGLNEPIFLLEACKDGQYHWLQRRQNDAWLSRIVRIFSRVGKLDWLSGD